jgi:hypothetical protein
LQGQFIEKVLDFYIEIHAELGRTWRSKNEGSFLRFRDKLLDTIKSSCNFIAFYPRNRNDYERHWINLEGNTNPRSGNVIRVLMPGLLDSEKRLVLPARVEVD